MLGKSSSFVTCANCEARKNSLFSTFCNENIEELDRHKSCNYYKKNQGVFIDGSYPRGVFCVNEGKVKVFTRGEGGKEQIIYIAGKGDIIGFRAMFSDEPFKVSATTLEESNVCFIAKDDFLGMVDSNPNLKNGIIKELSKELGSRAQFITDLSQKSVRERCACTLLILNDVYENKDINLSREDMANFIGTATETLIRLLKDFKDEGLIEIHTRKLTILNIDALIRIAGKP